MRRKILSWLQTVIIVTVLILLSQARLVAAPLEFHLRFDESVSAKPFSGRVYVLMSKKKVTTLPNGPRWFKTEPFFALDVKDWQPGQVKVIDAKALGFPHKLDEVPEGTYWIFAVMDINGQNRSIVRADGNAYSQPVAVEIDQENTGEVSFLLNKVYRSKAPKETERVRFPEMESKLLSEFRKSPVFMKAGVVLPKSYKNSPNKRYPTLYIIPGFGGSATGAFSVSSGNRTDLNGTEVICVVLDPNCRWGHCVFADSENNGPWGQALTEEFIPYLEKTYRMIARPEARLLTGHSSGGWSSLWLQVTYPDFFGGTWSTAPDPVDFRDFQLVNIYKPNNNIFRDAKGKTRPLARKKGKVLLTYKTFSDMEYVMGHGGQLRSFEAVFGPKGPDGEPALLWNRDNGSIDLSVAKTWERYDIRLILERNWKTLGPKLQGKLHVYMGAEDNFYLDGAVRYLKRSLTQLGSDAVVEIFPGRDHGTLMQKDLRGRIRKEMAEQLQPIVAAD